MTVTDVAFPKISLPKITRVALSNFDLYSNEPNASAEIERPVFCLIGANGLGKSTFLNTINFAITGVIPDPGRKFQSAQDYLRNAGRTDRADDYFSGRISEHARQIASVTIELAWATTTLVVTRDLFGGAGVTQLSIGDVASGAIDVLQSSDDRGGNLTEVYREYILKLTHLEDYAQFVFLIHFVATFDEGRHLLMWDDSALTNALYLAFGTDPVAAKAADKLQRDMDRESSRARNVRFSARHVSNRINQLAELLSDTETDEHTTDAELQIQHEALISRQSDAEQRMSRKQSELRDADLKWTDLSASLTESQLEYRRLFSDRLALSSSVSHHPIIRATLSEDRCAICGTVHVSERVRSSIDKGECPLCDSTLSRSDDDTAAITALQNLDRKIGSIRDELATILDSRVRISDELEAAQASEEAAAEQLREFEEKEATGLSRAMNGSDFSAIQQEIDKLEKERQDFLSQSKEHYKKRDELRKQLRTYEKKLKAQYEAGSERFVPRFRELAEEFIGLPVDVELVHRQGANDSGFGLRMRMDDQTRAQPDTVSESQRFFIDIALRMALSEYTTEGNATLLIDTPEGSLDIAYEARAGLMFSKFVAEGNHILMTANLRSSELVIRLAELQKSGGMQVVRMTDWTDLSEVQQTEEALFTKAYSAIGKALN